MVHFMNSKVGNKGKRVSKRSKIAEFTYAIFPQSRSLILANRSWLVNFNPAFYFFLRRVWLYKHRREFESFPSEYSNIWYQKCPLRTWSFNIWTESKYKRLCSCHWQLSNQIKQLWTESVHGSNQFLSTKSSYWSSTRKIVGHWTQIRKCFKIKTHIYMRFTGSTHNDA